MAFSFCRILTAIPFPGQSDKSDGSDESDLSDWPENSENSEFSDNCFSGKC